MCGTYDTKGPFCEKLFGENSEKCRGDFQADKACCACKEPGIPYEEFCCNIYSQDGQRATCELYKGIDVVHDQQGAMSFAYTFKKYQDQPCEGVGCERSWSDFYSEEQLYAFLIGILALGALTVTVGLTTISVYVFIARYDEIEAFIKSIFSWISLNLGQILFWFLWIPFNLLAITVYFAGFVWYGFWIEDLRKDDDDIPGIIAAAGYFIGNIIPGMNLLLIFFVIGGIIEGFEKQDGNYFIYSAIVTFNLIYAYILFGWYAYLEES